MSPRRRYNASERPREQTLQQWAARVKHELTDEEWAEVARVASLGFDEMGAEFFVVDARALLAEVRRDAAATFVRSDGKLNCSACCWARCDEPRHYHRSECPRCKGSGAMPDTPYTRVVARYYLGTRAS